MSRSTCDHESHTNTGIPSGPRLSDTDAFAWKRWEIVAWLFAAYFLHQADKQIYSVVLTPIQKEFGLSGFQSGLIGTAFTLVVAFVSPLAGALGDRWPQHRVVAISLMVWSGATAMSGAATGFLFFLFTRSILTASAEAFYPPVSHAYLASWHGDATRATAISIHQVAQYAGPVASGFLAAYIAERFGWRTSFYGFGIVGCLMALIMLRRLRSPPVSVNAREPSDKLFAGFLICFQSRGVRRIGFAFAAVLFASVGFGTWVPTYLLREFDLRLTQAGFQAALWASLGAMVGAVSGGWLSDRLKVAGHSRFSLQSVALSLAGICLLSMGTAPSLSTAMAWLTGVGYFKGIYEGTLAVSLYDYVPAKFRSSAAAVVLLLANLLAAPSAAILGFASDHADLRWPLSSLALFLLIAAGLLWRSRSLPTIQETQEELDVFRSVEK